MSTIKVLPYGTANILISRCKGITQILGALKYFIDIVCDVLIPTYQLDKNPLFNSQSVFDIEVSYAVLGLINV